MKGTGVLAALSAAALAFGVVGLTASPRSAHAAEPPAAPAPDDPQGQAPGGQLITSGIDPQTGTLQLLVNKSATLTTSRPYKRLSVGQPDIAEVTGIGPSRILITAKKAGTTQIIVWDEEDNSQSFDVLVQANLLPLRQLYDRLLPGSRIDVIDSDGTIALTGQVPNLAAAEQAQALASGYGQRVLNMLEVAGGQQVMLQVRFAEVSKSATSQLGVNIAVLSGSGGGASNIGQVNPTNILPGQGAVLGANAPINGWELQDNQSVSPSVTQYFFNQFGNVFVEAFITALRDNNLLRVLAEPNLVATSGQEAEFLAGGDFPVPIVQATGGQSAVTVNMIEFGVKLRFTPVVLGDGKIRLVLAPEVSDVDFTNAPTVSGFRIPGRRIRRLATTVELSEGQTFALGGLLDSRVAANKSVTPLLGDLPVLGVLFRSVRYQRQETELVVLVTPRIVSALHPGEVPKLPGEHWRHPTEGDLFLNQDIGGPISDEEAAKIPARRYIGRYGYVPAPDAPAAPQ